MTSRSPGDKRGNYPLRNDVRTRMRQELGWLPDPLFNIYYANWVKTGDAELSVWEMRQSPTYDRYFAGNRRDDGSLRWDEQTYLGITEDYADSLRNIGGVNPDLFRHKFGDLIAGNKSPDEFAAQVTDLLDRVVLDAPEMRRAYSEMWDVDITDEGLFAMALDPEMNQLVLNKRITMAEIASEGKQKGFSINKKMATALFNADMDEAAAADFFGSAGEWIPVLNTLARRHADPDDDFDLEEFSSSQIFQDPMQRKRMRRLVTQERAGFIGPGSFGTRATQDTGGLTGLAPR